jgi:hypothetical protein
MVESTNQMVKSINMPLSLCRCRWQLPAHGWPIFCEREKTQVGTGHLTVIQQYTVGFVTCLVRMI